MPESIRSFGEPMAPELTIDLAIGAQDLRLAAGLGDDLDADRPALLDHDAGHHHAGADGEVLPVADRLQIGDARPRSGGRFSA